MKKITISNCIDYAILIFLFLLPFFWLNGLLFAGGESFSILNSNSSWVNATSTWSNFGFGTYNLYIASLPLQLLNLAFSKILPLSIIHPLIMGINLSGSFIIFYKLMNRLYLRNSLSRVAAVFYIANPFYLMMLYWQPVYGWLFLITPISILLILNYLQNEKANNPIYIMGIFMAFFFSGILALNIGLYLIYIIILIAFVCGYHILEKLNSLFNLKSLILISLFIISSLYWLLPLELTYKETFSKGINYESNFSNKKLLEQPILNGITLNQYYWFNKNDNNGEPYYSYSSWYSSASKIVLLSLFTLIFFSAVLRPRKLSLLLILIFIIGVFLSKGTSSPFGNLYQFLLAKLPFFSIFRASDLKFQFLTTLAFASLIPEINILLLSTHKRTQRIIFIAIIIVMGISSLPMISQQVIPDQFTVRIPKEWEDLTKVVEALPKSSRILLLPQNDSSFDNYDWGYNGGWLSTQLFTVSSVGFTEGYGSSIQEHTFNKLGGLYRELSSHGYNSTNDSMDRYGITHILVRFDYLPNNKASLIADNLSANITAVKFKSENLLLFEVPNSINNRIISNPDTSLINIERLSPTEYNISVNSTKKMTLVFSDSYSQYWQLYDLSPHSKVDLVLKSLHILDLKYILLKPSSHFIHSQSTTYSNIWKSTGDIDSDLKSSFGIYYIPQARYKLGICIILIVFILLLGNLCINKKNA